MRVLHVTPYFAPAWCYGGPPRSVLGLCRALQQREIEVVVATTTANGPGEILPAERSQAGLAVNYFRRWPPKPWFFAPGLVRFLQQEIAGFDLVHIHGLWSFPSAAAARLARKNRVPYVISPRGMLDPGARAFKRRRKVLFYRLIERNKLDAAVCLHATSGLERRHLQAILMKPRIEVIPNGLDLQQFPVGTQDSGGFRCAWKIDPGKQLILFLGRIHPKKNLDLLIAALGTVRAAGLDAHLVLAGPPEGDYQACLQSLASTMGLATHVTFTGLLDAQPRLAALQAADVVALVSRAENFGMTVAEAMACAKPVVVSRDCGWDDVERHQCGLVVDTEPNDIARALAQLLQNSRSREQLGANGRKLIAEKYTWERAAMLMHNLYQQIQASKPAAKKASSLGKRTPRRWRMDELSKNS